MSDQDNAPPPDRRRPVHLASVEAPNRSPLVFVTVCTKDRRPLLASPGAHALLLEAWATAHHFQVGRYMIMPDHLASLLRAGCLPVSTASGVDCLLEIARGTQVVGSERGQALAARLLGYTTSVG